MSDSAQPIEYWTASAALDGLVTGYHRYSVSVPPGVTFRDAFFPNWGTIRIAMDGGAPWSLTMANRTFDPVPTLAFTGPSSHAGYVAAGNGVLVGAGILPCGWAQLFGGDVSRYANRVVPLTQIDAGAGQLQAALNDGADPKALFDEWLEARLRRRPPPDPRIAALYDLLQDPAVTRIEAIAETLNTPPRVLAALARFNFGFTPKLLLRRSRFMRALSAVLANPGDSSHLLTEAGYWDRSHFLRDSHLFLGCSVRDFLKRRGPLNPVAMRVREEVIGAAV